MAVKFCCTCNIFASWTNIRIASIRPLPLIVVKRMMMTVGTLGEFFACILAVYWNAWVDISDLRGTTIKSFLASHDGKIFPYKNETADDEILNKNEADF